MEIQEEIKDRFEFKQITQTNYVKKDDDNHYYVFNTDQGEIFVSLYKHFLAWPKYQQELNSLEQIRKTNTIYAPKPYGLVGDVEGNGAALVTEYIRVNDTIDWKLFGKELADLHHANYVTTKREMKRQQWVGGRVQTENGIVDHKPKEYFTEFGFIEQSIGAFYGKNEFVNVWHDDWAEFFSRYRLEPQFRRVIQYYGDREIIELWSNLQTQLDNYFQNIPPITPSLLHGDLDSMKVGVFKQTSQNDDGDDVQQDKCILLEPISFYGHSEFDLAKVKLDLKNDFPPEFYEEYHKKIKKTEGFDKRSKLYQLFFALNDYTKNDMIIKTLMRELLS